MPLGQVHCAVVGSPVRVAHGVSKLVFDIILAHTQHLIEDSLRRSAEPVSLISSFPMPMGHMAARIALSLIGRLLPPALGNTKPPRPVSGSCSHRVSTACLEWGTICGRWSWSQYSATTPCPGQSPPIRPRAIRPDSQSKSSKPTGGKETLRRNLIERGGTN